MKITARWCGIWGVGIALTFGCSSGNSTQKQPAGEAVRSPSPVDVVRGFSALRSRIDANVKIEAHPDAQWLAKAGAGASLRPDSFSVAVPRQSSGAVRLAREGDENTWLEIRTIGAAGSVAGSIEQGAVTYRGAERDLDVVLSIGASRFEELRVLRTAQAPTVARYAVDVPAGMQVRLNDGRVEVLDTTGRVAFRSDAAFAVDSNGTQRAVELKLAGQEITESLDPVGLAFPVIVARALVTPTTWPAQAVVAQNSIELGGTIVGDAVVVQRHSGTTIGSFAMGQVDANAQVTGSLTADTIRVQPMGVVTVDARFNTFSGTGTVRGKKTTPLTLPVPVTLPSFPSFTAGTTDVTSSSTTTPLQLASGSYRNLNVKQGTTLRPTGGVYTFATVTFGSSARIECLATCTLRFVGRFTGAASTFVGPATTATFNSDGVEVYVSAANGTSSLTATPAVSFGATNTINARLSAPNGTISAASTGTKIVGTLVARDVLLSTGVQLTKDVPTCTANDNNRCTQDTCNATGQPVFTPLPSGTACADTTVCNGAETCNGAGVCAAGVPLVVDDGNPCTTDACDPTAGVTHKLLASGASCSDGNVCNGAELCNATGVCGSGTPLVVNDGNPCTTDSCDPKNGVSHVALAVGAQCSDGNACNGMETCKTGAVCGAGTPPVVDDGKPCTKDSCDPTLGVVHAPLAAGTSCTDGNACNGAEVCDAAGGCLAGTALVVDDGNPCTADSCSAQLGVSHVAVANGTSCADSNVCNGAEACQSGSCAPGTAIAVDDGNPCTTDTCDPVAGVKHTAVANGTACPDGNACNGTELCANGACTAGTPPTLDDANPCTADSCDTKAGVKHVPVATGTSCSDGNACNGNETCTASGSCVASAPPVVDDGNPCTADTCQPPSGVTHTPVAAGVACPDGNACNGAELCNAAGACVAGTAPAVDDGNPCTSDSCDPVAGVRHLPVATGTSCSDGNACNGNEACDGAGACQPGPAPVVDDANPCTADSCTAVGGVKHTPLAQGAACSDGNACNGVEQCNGSGVCSAGVALVVDDGNPCTADSCDPLNGVSHSPVAVGTSCDDGDLCNGHETCNSIGFCAAGPALAVDDGNPCTADTCSAGNVSHTPVSAGTSCSDGNLCNGTEQCDAVGACQAGTPVSVDDGNPCTLDACSSTTGVTHQSAPSGTSCSDSNVCNGNEQCNASGQCSPGTPLTLDDGNPCTADSCDAVAGVQHTPLVDGTSCIDANTCNGVETCQAGMCTPLGGIVVVADDGNPCTADSCTLAAGVKHVPLSQGAACDDGTVCNGHETCDGTGQCQPGTALVLDDGQSCTLDSCDPVVGVKHSRADDGTSCSDGNACTKGDTCSGGICTGGAAVVCAATDFCRAAACDPSTGLCGETPKLDGTLCPSDNVCVSNTFCHSGRCGGGTPVDVDDHDPCTTDLCDAITGPAHVPSMAGTSCSDNNPCNGSETCNGSGLCLPGALPSFSDGNPCTLDTCDSVTGIAHTLTPSGTGCDDDTVCNGREACDGLGGCHTVSTELVDDSNPCTADSCDAIAGVTHVNLPPATSCDDTTICNGREACDGHGSCLVGVPPSIDDHDPCTSDTCDPVTGVAHGFSPAGTSCSDGNACNGDERCDATGRCTPGAVVVVDDGKPCTADTCDAATGVVSHVPLIGGTSCANGNLCDGVEICDGQGACNVGTPPIVDDGDPCTDDACDPVAGVTHVHRSSSSCVGPAAWQTLIASQPSPRDAAAGVFTDAGEFFAFGGENAGSSLADTWLWSAARNGWRRGAVGPAARSGAGVGFDSQRQRVVVVGGVTGSAADASYLGDVWEYAPATDSWQVRSAPGAAPPGRALAAFAYDSQHGRGILFGGVGPTHLSDTWEWTASNGAWVQVTGQGPSARFGAAFAFDPAHGVYVLFGGSPQGVTGGALDDTWTFDATTGLWQLRASAVKPPARAGATMTFDGSVSRLVMVGGTSVNALDLSDVWEFDVSTGNWTQLASTAAPAQTGAVAGFDPTSAQVLVAVGLSYSDSGRFTTDAKAVWAFSRQNQQWQERTATTAPAILELGGVYDERAKRIVARSVVQVDDTSTRPIMWSYDASTHLWSGTDSTALESDFGSGAYKGPASATNALVYDSSRNLTLRVFSSPSSNLTLGRIRISEWDGAQWTNGCQLDSTTAFGLGVGNASVVFDPRRKRVLIIGSAYAGINAVDPVSCTVSFIPYLAQSGLPAVAWDSDRDVFVMFGGTDLSSATRELNPLDGSIAQVTTSGPTARSGAAMAYDSARKKMVQYGGGANRDTWEYTASTQTWSQVSLAGGPDTGGSWLLFDPVKMQSVLVGRDGSIWVWNGAAWIQDVVSATPSARSGMSGGWVPSLGAGVFFGGTSGDGRRAFLSDLWMWNGGWRQASPPGADASPLLWGGNWINGVLVAAAGPSARTGHVLATGYSPASDSQAGANQIALLFGGEGDAGLLGDTWTLDRSTLQWTLEESSALSPSARTGHAMSVSPDNGYVMFGGLTHPSGGQDTLVNDTWFWTPGWSQLQISGAPSPRYGHAMATDEARKEVILFGGRDASGVLGDTWLLDLKTLQSTGWQKLAPASSPLARFGHSMSFDSVRGRIVLTGGEGGVPAQGFGDTWEWDAVNRNWIRRNVTAIDVRVGHTSFFDRKLAETVAFGGFAHDANGLTAHTYGDTIAFASANQIDPPFPHPNGDACSVGTTCASGICADGVCCNTTCNGQCAACDVAGAQGTCTALLGAPHGARPTCTGSAGQCGAACNGADMTTCHPAVAGTTCGAPVGCNGGLLEQGPGICDGAGSCTQSATSCLPYACGSPPFVSGTHDACFPSCHGDGYCFSSDYRCTRPDTGTCYLADKILSVTLTPATPTVGTPVTITVHGSLDGPPGATKYGFHFVNAQGTPLDLCGSGITNLVLNETTCAFTPGANDQGAGSITVWADAAIAQTLDDTKVLPITIGAHP